MPKNAQKESTLKNETHNLAGVSTPAVSAPTASTAPSALNWLASRRPAWLPFKPDAGTDAKNAIAQERENLIRDLTLLKTALESEIQAKTQAFEALAQEQQQRAQAEDERMALSTQMRQAQDDLERLGLTNKALQEDTKALAQTQRDLEVKAKTEIDALQARLTQEKATLTQEKQTLAQEKTKAIAARDAEAKAKTEALAKGELEAKAKADVQLKLEAETKAKAALQKEKAALTQDKQSLSQEITALKASLASEAKAKAEALAQGELEAKAKAEAQLKLEAETKAKAALQKEKAALTQDKQSLSQEITALKASLASEAKTKAQAAEQLAQETSARKQAEEEGTLLLTQLHQVQEELERFYLSNKALEKDAKALAQTQRDLEAKAKAEIDALQASFAQEKAALTQEKAKAIAARDAEAKAKSEALAKGELEAKAKADAQLKLEAETKAKAALQIEKTALAQDKQSLSQEITALKASLATEAKAKAQTAGQLAHEMSGRKQAEEEGTLLLTQLHEVQEELERYYRNNKDLQTSLRQTRARFGRVVSRQPEGIDWDAVQIQPLMVDGKPALRCKAVNVAVMGKEWQTLEFLAFDHDGVLSVCFERGEDASGTGPLTRWPRAAAALPALAVRVGQDANDEPNLNTLKDLSTSDWDLLRGLPRLVAEGLQSPPAPWPMEQPDVAIWQAAALATPPALKCLPVALRFDAFKINGAATLPGYENLQIQLNHLDLGAKRFENFEFRFACNLGTQGEFGANARLEFFKLNGAPVFEQWAPNYRDGQSERLDLVFVFPSTLNLKEFSALSTNDRALVLLLADLLPALLADASPNGLALNRSLEEWTALAQKLRSFVRARLDVTGVQKQPGALVDAVSAGRSVQRPEKTNDVTPKATRRPAKSEPLKFRKRVI